MPCGKHGLRASVTTKTSAFGLGFCLLSPSGHVFHTARETMIKSYNELVITPHCLHLAIMHPYLNLSVHGFKHSNICFHWMLVLLYFLYFIIHQHTRSALYIVQHTSIMKPDIFVHRQAMLHVFVCLTSPWVFMQTRGLIFVKILSVTLQYIYHKDAQLCFVF